MAEPPPRAAPPASSPPPLWACAATGLLAAVAGMAAGHLAAGLLSPESSPVLAVGSVVIDATPTPLKEWAVATLGTSDKPILVGSVTAVTLLAAGLTGLLLRRSRTVGLLVLVALAAVAALAAVTRPAAGPLAVVPGLVTGLVGVASAAGLLRLLPAPRPAADPAALGRPTRAGGDGRSDRRGFLAAAAGVGALAVGAGAAGQRLGRAPAPPGAALPTPARPLPAPAAGLERTVPGVSALHTPASAFYRIDTALVIPRVDAASWTLTIDGEVEHPVTITYAELLAMPMVEADVTLTCVSNEVGGDYAGSARWLGVRTRDLLSRAGIRASADQVLSRSVDGMTISTPVAALTDDRDALVAVAMNGAPLPAAHGFPARLVTPGLYGFVGATKWLARLTLTTYAASEAYWTQRGWVTDAPVLTQARIDTPKPLSDIASGRIAVGGVAWAQHRGIRAVEVRVDDGAWQPARLGPDIGIDSWRQWWLPWDAAPGRHRLTARATDATGAVQPEQASEPYPRGATGWHTVEVTVT